jgi:predicted lipid-binding transport protein (Tim44 family)
MGVILLLVLIWAVVLIPPALRSHAARQEAFLVSLGTTPAPSLARPVDPQALRIQRRRRIAGGLLIAMTTTLLMGLLPTFRVLLFVHLFLLDSFIAYIALLAHAANRAARPAAVTTEPAPARPRRWRRAVVAELGPIAPLA